ncbi:ATP-dependent DNA helicase [Candidatus Xianfuyuplasma coldseepsis]|uniref:ATP-dependent DNA helicase n=1 Tax=Candidatus Xianfuyuplasma coldseepsis TaxID=2782163 RepID=A0A7L7KNZ2_9MOLU|nr:ATP-dependent DNA helicase [Xianfuyuplasma coldseepsis]QMS84491.1 ATP-dependent DNA helicase [Xianfuyuplasma coldseepsis]
MKSIKIAVKEMVEFIHVGGDLTSEFKSNKRAKLGQEAHAFLQAKYGDDDQQEVMVETLYQNDDYELHISGRMDGLLQVNNKPLIEEIKSTQTDLEFMDIDTRPEHLAQVKMYAYMYCKANHLKSIKVRLVYIHIPDYETKSFTKRYNISQLTKFFENTVFEYLNWVTIYDQHQAQKLTSIEGLTFPFEDYREGQYTFMGAIYKTIIANDILYSIAPTGIGKTVAALFSALKAIETERDKVFYLTAKNAGKAIVVDTVNLLKDNGLVAKTVVINNKEHMCLMDTVDCDPDICPYAKGYFDRVQEALNDIFVHKDVYESELIKSYGEYHKICPHEFSLSISNFSDIVICDYNYAFDPRTHLIRYFDEDYYNPILLVDEAHNMIDRSRSMYSSSITKSGLLALKKAAKKVKPSVQSTITKIIKYIDEFATNIELIKQPFYHQEELDEQLLVLLERLVNKLDQILVENKKFPNRDQVLDGYFMCTQFIRISDFYASSYRYILEAKDEDIVITLSCLDASKYILDTIERRAKGAIFFSATLEPVDYHVRLITKGEGKSISIPSPFPQHHLGLFVDDSTSTRYRDRERSIDSIIDNIYAMLETKVGNYIVFFPSYRYLNRVLEQFDTEAYDVVVQERNMNFKTRNKLLQSFDEVGETSTVGFFVMGGSFSEGIDYIGDKLHGVLIVGVAMPQFNPYNELLRNYFDELFETGFDYAYTFPGMNKVIQAVGRVIRTEEDQGIAILFDDRYSHRNYRTLFPKNWQHAITIRVNNYVQNYLEKFWQNIKKSV